MHARLSIALVAVLWFGAVAEPQAEAGRYRLLASRACLRTPVPAQSSTRFALTAELGAAQVIAGAQTGSRYTLIVSALSASSLVCYSDTIFRDGFDGTGL